MSIGLTDPPGLLALRIGLSTPPFGTTQRGRFREHGRWSFLDVDDRERTVVLYLTGHEYRRVVLTVDDPETLIEKLRTAFPSAVSVDLDAHPAVLDADGEAVDRLEGGKRERRARRDVEAGAVTRADRDALVDIPFAFAERAVVVRAAVLDRVQAAVAVVDADRDRARPDDLDVPRR